VSGKGIAVDRDALATATELAKADLTTELVKEFTELQGIVGGQYARAQGHSEPVAEAIYWQYSPASTQDQIPPTIEGRILGIADRLQTIDAMFSLGLEPTGSKDPFALRRAANGIIKIIADSELPITLTELLGWTPEVLNKASNKGYLEKLKRLFDERISFWMLDVRGFAYDVVNAVLAAGSDDVPDAIARAEALTAVRGSKDFAAISAAFKRIKNILRQAEEKGFLIQTGPGVVLTGEAQQLSNAATALVPEVAKLRQQRAYGEALGLIATLRPTVDAFFDKVMVLDPDPDIRGANLGLIKSVLNGFSDIADFSEIVTS
jgi:glycyl-tRNA synthetase beta chain